MANFRTHLTSASLISGLLSTALLKTGFYSPGQLILFFSMGSIGGILPDIDADESIPLRSFVILFSIPLAVISTLTQSKVLSVIEIVVIFFLFFIFFRYILLHILKYLTTHRGMMHSLPASILFSMVIIVLMDFIFIVPKGISWLSGFFFMIGYISHLLLDEFTGIKIFHFKTPGTGGNPLKIVDRNNLKITFIFYLLIILLVLIAPELDRNIFKLFESSTWENIKLFPSSINKLFNSN